jgi:nucleotide-binding universal stress UspA family protein
MAGLIIVGYDGSADAQRAMTVAAGFVRVESALVLTAWHLPIVAAEGAIAPVAAPAAAPREQQPELEQAARRTAQDGAGRARAAGIQAEAETRRCAGAADVARTLMDVAEERDADLVVVGRRGISRLKAAVLGSVSDAVLRDGGRPVLVVPGGEA